MREVKKHWIKGKTVFSLRVSLCGLISPAFANKKRAVTCLTCKRLIAGYQGEVK